MSAAESRLPQAGDKVIVSKRQDGDWGWCVKARNGKLIATSGEGFKRKKYAADVARRVTGIEPTVFDEGEQ